MKHLGIQKTMQDLVTVESTSLLAIYAIPSTGAAGVATMGCSISAGGTATAAALAATRKYSTIQRLEYLVTTAATTAIASLRSATYLMLRGGSGLGGFDYTVVAGVATGATNSTLRGFFGLRSSVAVPTDVNPSTLTQIIGIGWDAGDTNLSIMSNAALASATKIDLGAEFPRPSVDNTHAYELRLFSGINDPTVLYTVINVATGAVVMGALSTNIPASRTLFAPCNYVSVGGTSSVVGLMFGGFSARLS